MLFKNVVAPGFLAGLMLLLGFGSVAQAASACKGLSSSQCSSKSDCVWVGGYTRKDNRKVSGYCRSKGGKATSSGKSQDKGAATRSSEKKSKKEKSAIEKKSTENTSKDKKSKKKSKSDSKKSKSKEKKKTDKSKTSG